MSPLLCLDRGNSALKAVLYEGDRLLARPDLSGDPEIALASLPEGTEAALCSVAPSRDVVLVEALRRRAIPFWRLRGDSPVPFPVDLTGRESLGSDRLAGMAAAWFSGRYPAVVVDAGSAVTLDLMDEEGRFRGGFILPGEALWLRSLARGGELLPDLAPDGEPFPGTDTEGALRGGAAWGLAEATEGLAGRLGGLCRGTVSVILTGGGSAALARRWRGDPPLREPDWILEGLRRLHLWKEEPRP